jgi:hypothetical protein
MALISRTGILLAIVAVLAVPANGQQYNRSVAAGGPFSDVPVLNAPFSADARTRVRQALADGTVREHTITARYYRDSQGHVRAELDTPWGPYVLLQAGIEIPDFDLRVVTLDPAKRTYRQGPPPSFAALVFNGEGRVALPVGKACFQTTRPVVADVSDEERLQAVNARMSPDLRIVTESHRSGTIAVDYAVTNIQRVEPAPELFEVPKGYRYVSSSLPDPMITLAPWSGPAPGDPACKPLTR